MRPSDVSACALSASSIGSAAPSIFTLSGRNAGSSAPVTPTARYGSSTTRPVHSGSALSASSACTASSGSARTAGNSGSTAARSTTAAGRPDTGSCRSLPLSRRALSVTLRPASVTVTVRTSRSAAFARRRNTSDTAA